MSTDEYVPSEKDVRHAYVVIENRRDILAARAEFDRFLARVRRDAARVAWYEGQASGWRSAQEECEMNGTVGDLYHPYTETEQCPYEEATP